MLRILTFGRSVFVRCLLVLLLIVITNNLTFAQGQYITYQQAMASLKTNRDRLLDSYASQRGKYDRFQAWNDMSSSQKGVFLTVTDLLGRRTYMNYNGNNSVQYYPDYEDEIANCMQLNQPHLVSFPNVGEEGVYITFGVNTNVNYTYDPNVVCELVDAYTCVNMGKCTQTQLPRIDHDMALNHVTMLYAVNGSNGGDCGGGDNNRMYFAVDDQLMFKIRNLYPGMPEWGASTDPAGPHSPFTQSRETNGGLFGGFPKGQMHEWAWDYEASTLNRYGVYGVYDPRIVEMDIDYKFAGHPSNPECYYDGQLGRYKYQNKWWNLGLGGSAEFEYTPY